MSSTSSHHTIDENGASDDKAENCVAGGGSTSEESVESLISIFRSMDEGELKKHKTSGGMELSSLKRIAMHLRIPKSANKPELIKALKKKLENKSVIPNAAANLAFRKDQNTVPRLLHILSFHIEELVRTGRTDLQISTVGPGNTLWATVAEEFNSPDFAVGPSLCDHEEAIGAGVDPMATNAGILETNQAYTLFFTVKKDYTIIYGKYYTSGKNDDFWAYCQGKLDLLYMHYWLEEIGHPGLMKFCGQVGIGEGGGSNTPASATAAVGNSGVSPHQSTPVPASTSKKRSSPSAEESMLQYFQLRIAEMNGTAVGVANNDKRQKVDDTESLTKVSTNVMQLRSQLVTLREQGVTEDDIVYKSIATALDFACKTLNDMTGAK